MKERLNPGRFRMLHSLLHGGEWAPDRSGEQTLSRGAGSGTAQGTRLELSPKRPQLFIIGPARSGTTVLQNALNASRDIFLFGEPRFHEDSGLADFAVRYNAMHRAWGNQETKSTFCPPLFEGDARWFDYLVRLAALHRFVGSKIVVNPEHALDNCERLFDFHCRHFYTAHYVFTFRNPIDVLMSTRGLAELTGYTPASCDAVLNGFLAVMALYIRMLRNLPSVTVLCHETIGAGTFESLGRTLDLDLSEAFPYYDTKRVRHYTLDDIPLSSRARTAEVLALYEQFREQSAAGFPLTQLEQNAGHFDDSHYTAIGMLDRRVQSMLSAI